ncbi:MAG TPA: type III pantothenate kinase [Sedimentisphaerales bacterium]|nr:type III pantothenate kinase [Sedimentisphaerales bacterium]
MTNLIAIDIGNTNISIGLFLQGQIDSIESISGNDTEKLTDRIKTAWDKIPVLKTSKEKKRDGVIVVCSVNPKWTKLIKQIVKDNLDEKTFMIGEDITLPIELAVTESNKVGIDRVVSAAAAYAVTEHAVVVADFGTAVTIDMVDDRGVFVGGVIFPGFAISAKALKDNTALLPEITVSRPILPFGQNTEEAINCGLYYSAIGALEEVVRRYAEKIGTWPQTIITGSGAKIIKDDCQFVDSYVPDLVVRGIALAYSKFLDEKME